MRPAVWLAVSSLAFLASVSRADIVRYYGYVGGEKVKLVMDWPTSSGDTYGFDVSGTLTYTEIDKEYSVEGSNYAKGKLRANLIYNGRKTGTLLLSRPKKTTREWRGTYTRSDGETFKVVLKGTLIAKSPYRTKQRASDDGDD